MTRSWWRTPLWNLRQLLTIALITAGWAACWNNLPVWQFTAVTVFWAGIYLTVITTTLRRRLRTIYLLGSAHTGWQRDLLDRGYIAAACPNPHCTAPAGHIHYLPPAGRPGQLTVWPGA